MSAPGRAEGPTHDPAPDRAAGDAGHGTRRSYVIGFLLSAVLTAVPFWLVMDGTLGSARATAFVVMGLAAVQMVVHMVCFLHLNTRSENGWTIMALVFTLVLVGIALSGSLWVMYHMNANMMPGGAAGDMSGM